MDALAGIELRDSSWLWLLLATPIVLALLVWRERTRVGRASRFVSARLRGDRNPFRVLRPWLVTAGGALVVVALAGPRAGFTIQAIPGGEATTVIVLDTSLSMNAEDVGTSRLTAAKALARRLIEVWPGRVGLVVFEGNAEVVAPITDDGAAVETLIESIGAGELAEPGSDIGRALDAGLSMIARAGGSTSAILVLSDGEHRGAPYDDALKRATDARIPITTVLIGGAVPATIPSGEDRSPLRDERGAIVETTAVETALRDIATRTGGEHVANPFSSGDTERLVAGLGRGSGGRDGTPRESRVPVERFQWPLGAAFLLLLGGSLLHRGAE